MTGDMVRRVTSPRGRSSLSGGGVGRVRQSTSCTRLIVQGSLAVAASAASVVRTCTRRRHSSWRARIICYNIILFSVLFLFFSSCHQCRAVRPIECIRYIILFGRRQRQKTCDMGKIACNRNRVATTVRQSNHCALTRSELLARISKMVSMMCYFFLNFFFFSSFSFH